MSQLLGTSLVAEALEFLKTAQFDAHWANVLKQQEETGKGGITGVKLTKKKVGLNPTQPKLVPKAKAKEVKASLAKEGTYSKSRSQPQKLNLNRRGDKSLVKPKNNVTPNTPAQLSLSIETHDPRNAASNALKAISGGNYSKANSTGANPNR